KMPDLHEAVHIFNQMAEKSGSERRLRVEVYPTPFEFKDPSLQLRVIQLTREDLTAVRDALRAGSKTAYHSASDRARCAHLPFVGAAQQRILEALEAAERLRKDLGRALAEGGQPEEIGAGLDLDPIEAALTLLEEPQTLPPR